jgi:hypothetical protein
MLRVRTINNLEMKILVYRNPSFPYVRMCKKQWQATQGVYGQSSEERTFGGNIAENALCPI